MSASNSSPSRSGSADTTLARAAGRLLVPMAPGAYSAIMTWTSGPLGSRVDLLLLALGGADFDLPRLRLLGDRDPQGQDALAWEADHRTGGRGDRRRCRAPSLSRPAGDLDAD